jgi:hypothetical protein
MAAVTAVYFQRPQDGQLAQFANLPAVSPFHALDQPRLRHRRPQIRRLRVF